MDLLKKKVDLRSNRVYHRLFCVASTSNKQHARRRERFFFAQHENQRFSLLILTDYSLCLTETSDLRDFGLLGVWFKRAKINTSIHWWDLGRKGSFTDE